LFDSYFFYSVHDKSIFINEKTKAINKAITKLIRFRKIANRLPKYFFSTGKVNTPTSINEEVKAATTL
jgi:hypothetical protein